MYYKFLPLIFMMATMIISSLAKPLGRLDERTIDLVGRDTQDPQRPEERTTGTPGSLDQGTDGLSPAQQFCAYQGSSGTGGLNSVAHKLQNAVLGGSMECTLQKSSGVKTPEVNNIDHDRITPSDEDQKIPTSQPASK